MKTGALSLMLLWSTGLFGQASSAAGTSSGLRPCSWLTRPANATKAIDAEDLFQAYSTQVRLVRSLHMIASMKGTAGIEYETGSEPLALAAIVDLMQPNLIRITGVVPY